LIDAHQFKIKQDGNAKKGEEANTMGEKPIKKTDATETGMMPIKWGWQ